MIKILRDETFPIKTQNDIVSIRRVVREWAGERGFGLTDQTKIITAARELARNTLVYGQGGELNVQSLQDGNRKGLRLAFMDQGPGIEDLEMALSPGYSTSKGLGMGLSGSQKLVSEFDVQSNVGLGTTVTVTKWHNR